MIVLVHLERERNKPPSGWWAEIPDHPGFTAAADDWPELVKLVEEAVVIEGWDRPVFTRPEMRQCPSRPALPRKLSCWPLNHMSVTTAEGLTMERWFCSCGEVFRETGVPSHIATSSRR